MVLLKAGGQQCPAAAQTGLGKGEQNPSKYQHYILNKQGLLQQPYHRSRAGRGRQRGITKAGISRATTLQTLEGE